MRLLIGLLLSFVVAAGIGLGSTWYALTQNLAFGSLSLGAWMAFPRSGTPGIAFTATEDDEGRALDGRCTVFVRGITPPARYFTVTLYTPSGALVANPL